MGKVFVGHDWAETHHDVFVSDGDGHRLGGGRLPEGIEGVARFHELVGAHVDDPAEVVVTTETDRGLFVGALVAAGYTVLAINPMSTSRYRERHSTSGAKSDPGDAKVLADLARTDALNHRAIAGDSDLAEAIKVLARAHQSLIWTRQRQLNQLRSTLREFFPAALDAFKELGHSDALAVPAVASTPELAAITASPGARAFYDARRAAGDTHHRALRALANRLVGILHGCLRHGTLYDEHIAWGHRTELIAA